MGPHELIKLVSDWYNIPVDDVMGPCRSKTVAEARSVVMYLLRQRKYRLRDVGTILNKDHTTVIYGCRRVASRIKTDREFAVQIAYLCNLVKSVRIEVPGMPENVEAGAGRLNEPKEGGTESSVRELRETNAAA